MVPVSAGDAVEFVMENGAVTVVAAVAMFIVDAVVTSTPRTCCSP